MFGLLRRIVGRPGQLASVAPGQQPQNAPVARGTLRTVLQSRWTWAIVLGVVWSRVEFPTAKAQTGGCPDVVVTCCYIGLNGQPTNDPPAVVDGGVMAVVDDNGTTTVKYHSSFNSAFDYDTGTGLSWPEIKWLCNHVGGASCAAAGACPFGGAPYQSWWSTLNEQQPPCAGASPCSTGTCSYTWTGSTWAYWQGTCGGASCKCCPPTSSGTYLGETGTGSCVATSTTCPGGNPGPCDSNGGDADGDGCCADVDCNDNDSQVCNCTPDPCDDHGGDGDGDGCCADEDPDDGNPNNNCDTPCYLEGDGDDDGCCTPDDCDDSDNTKCSNCSCTGTCLWDWDAEEHEWVAVPGNECRNGQTPCNCCPPQDDGEAGDTGVRGTCRSDSCPNKCDGHGGDNDGDKCCGEYDLDDDDPENKKGCECGCRDFTEKYWLPIEQRLRRWSPFGDAGQDEFCEWEFEIALGTTRQTVNVNWCQLGESSGVASVDVAISIFRAGLLVLVGLQGALFVTKILLSW